MRYTNPGDFCAKLMSRKKAWIILIIRIILGLGLIYGIFLETGILTSLFALFILIGTEIRGHVIRRLVNDTIAFHSLMAMILTGHPPSNENQWKREHHPNVDADSDMVD